MPRSEKFFVEFISLTILSFVAANLWNRCVSRFLDKYKSSVVLDLIIAVAVTASAILLMKTFFAKNKSFNSREEYQKDYKQYNKFSLSSAVA